MLSVAVVKPDQVELVDIPVPTPGPYEARIHSEAACLCNATDRKLIEGHFPGVEDYPLILGHESVGIVDAVGDKVCNFQVGDRIVGGLLLNSTNPAYASGWGGFSEYVLAGDHHAMVADGVAKPENNWFEVYEIMRTVPASISVEDAVMLCTWREVYGAFGDFQLQEGDDILIYGAGPVGLSFVKFARLLGLGFICVVEIIPEKRQKAIEMGADVLLAPDEQELKALVDQRQKPFDAVIDAVGKEAIINAALPLVKMAGSVCVYGVIDTPTVNLQKSKGPYNFNLFVHQWPTRFREAAAQEPLCEWIKAGKLSHREFISVEYPINQINQAIELSKIGQTIKTLLRF
ncbi:zinc-binding dehydrogenase [Chloroflexota bacterium]